MKKRYIFLGFIVLLSFYRPGLIIPLVSLAYVLYLINRIENKSNRDQGLTRGDQVKVIITELLTPIIAGVFYYFCLKDTHPIKAKQALKYNWIVFSIQFVGLILIIAFSLLPLLATI